jgi:hypothetical protein
MTASEGLGGRRSGNSVGVHEVDGRLALSYVLPIRRASNEGAGGADDQADLAGYLRELSSWVAEVIVVDGSPPEVFGEHGRLWGAAVRHVPPDPSLAEPPDKASGVVTGSRLAVHDVVVVGDDDVRWTHGQLAEVLARMEGADLVRPQNRFSPAPWHARWDTARMLLNRAAGGDWPGTMVVRRSFVARGYGYGVLFENLDLVRTVRARGGRTIVARDVVVDRRPPEAGWFWRQRVRQAYDELARPWRFAWQLALVPLVLIGGRRAAVALAGAAVAAAEVGRRRGGRTSFPATAALWAPAWLAERAVCSWLALAARLRGGVRYRGRRVLVAATPARHVRRRVLDEDAVGIS